MPASLPTSRLLPSYGRRRGRKLRSGKQSLIDTQLPRLQLSLRDVEAWGCGDRKENFISCFSPIPLSPHPPIFLEIGFGGGEHLAHLAQRYPNTVLIGCETYINGIGDLLKKISAEALTNIRLFTEDARLLIEKLPNACLDKVFILYPDPWPKVRHHKRRIISKEFLDNIARTMKPGAELRLATDHSDYATWMLEQLLAHPAFQWTGKRCDDWLKPWTDWIPTKYEQKRLAGMPTYLTFICHPERA